MTSASHDAIVDLIGDVDELLVERLVADYRTLATSPRVAEVRAILEEVRDDLDDEYAEHPDSHAT